MKKPRFPEEWSEGELPDGFLGPSLPVELSIPFARGEVWARLGGLHFVDRLGLGLRWLG